MMHLPQLEEEPIKLFMVIAITLIKLLGTEATLNLLKKSTFDHIWKDSLKIDLN